MTDNPETPPRLSPPPKVGRAPAASRADAAISRRARADRGLLYWLTGVVFLLLAATAFAVFVFLPDWVPEPTSQATTPTTIEGDPPFRVASEETDPATAPVGAKIEPTPDEPATDPPAVPSTITPVPAPQPPPDPPTEPTRSAARPVPPAKSVDPTETAFNQAMTEGLARLEAGELAAAERAFGQALSLRPGFPAATDGLARVEAERQLLAIADHRERAVAHVEQERWKEAAAEYAAVLALDPTIRFAQEGQANATARQSLGDRLTAHIAHPDRLSADEALADAEEALSEARRIDRPGPILSRQIDRLAVQIDIARTLIPVVLLSDGETEVLVYRVGPLGAFERHALELRPGSYTVVGTRSGYRDVRRTLEVTPGKTNISLTVRCEEKI